MHLRLAMYLRTAITRSGISSGPIAVGHPIEDERIYDGRSSLIDWLAWRPSLVGRYKIWPMHLRLAMYLRTAITGSGISSRQIAVGHPIEDERIYDGRSSPVAWLAQRPGLDGICKI